MTSRVYINIEADSAIDAREEMARLLGTVNMTFAPARSSSSEPQPPVDNDHVAEGAEQFSPEVIAANAPKRVRGQPSPGKARRTKAEIAEDDAAPLTIASMTILPDDSTPAQVAEAFAGLKSGAQDSPEVQAADAADEAAETAAAKVDGKLTLDDVRNALGGYVNKFGMAAAQADGPQLIAKVLGVAHDPAAPKKISDLGDDQVLLKRAVDGVAEMIAKDPFKRAVAA